MDLLVRFSALYVADVGLRNKTFQDFLPGIFSYLLPVDLLYILANTGFMIWLALPSKCMLFAARILYLFAVFYANSDLHSYYPGEYFGKVLHLLLILSSAYLFKITHKKSEYLMWVMVAVLCLANIVDLPLYLFIAKYLMTTYLLSAAIKESGTRPIPLTEFHPSGIMNFGPKFRQTLHHLTVYWLVLVTRPTEWFSTRQWDWWSCVFGDGLDTSTRVCGLSALLILVNYHLFNAVQKFLFRGKIPSSSVKYSIGATYQFLLFAWDERVWNLEAEKRAELVQVLLFAHSSFLILAIYDISRLPLFAHNPRNDINKREERENALKLSIFLLISSVFLLYFGCSKVTNRSYPFAVWANIIYLVFKMILDVCRCLVNNFPALDEVRLARSRRVLSVLDYSNQFLRKSLLTAFTLRLMCYEAVTLFRVVKTNLYLCLDFYPALNFFYKQVIARSYVRSLPKVSREQLSPDNANCLICYESMEEACFTPCQHYYHAKCLLDWLQRNNKCPLCRSVLYDLIDSKF